MNRVPSCARNAINRVHFPAMRANFPVCPVCIILIDILDRSLQNVNQLLSQFKNSTQEPHMARPRGYDEVAALDLAIECFRLGGYTATSTRDLARSMGIGAASLYNCFGDKRALFIEALGRYIDQSVRSRLKRLESSLEPKQAILKLIEEVIERSVTDRTRGGCLLINSAVEIAPRDRILGSEITAGLREIESFFHRMIVDAQRQGNIPGHHAPDDLARMMLAVLVGIRVLARSNPDRLLLEGIARPAFKCLN